MGDLELIVFLEMHGIGVHQFVVVGAFRHRAIFTNAVGRAIHHHHFAIQEIKGTQADIAFGFEFFDRKVGVEDLVGKGPPDGVLEVVLKTQ